MLSVDTLLLVLAGADGRACDHAVQIEHHHNTAFQPVFVTGDGNIQHTVVITHALIDKAGQVQIGSFDVDLVLADGTDLGHVDSGIGGGGADRAGVQIHAPFGNEGDLTAGNTLNGHGGGADIRTVAFEMISTNLGQIAAIPLQTHDGIGPPAWWWSQRGGICRRCPTRPYHWHDPGS